MILDLLSPSLEREIDPTVCGHLRFMNYNMYPNYFHRGTGSIKCRACPHCVGRYAVYPNKTQAEQFNKLLGCYRFVYNQCLARKIKSYEETKTSENLSTLGKFVHHELLKDDNFI